MTAAAATKEAHARVEQVFVDALQQLELRGILVLIVEASPDRRQKRLGFLKAFVAITGAASYYIECRAPGVRRTRGEAVRLRRARASGMVCVSLEDAAILPNVLHRN
jgi:hypothetical protein